MASGDQFDGPGQFLRLMVGSASVEIRRCLWDVGMVQADALGSDPEGTLTALAALQGTLSSTIDAEVSWITAQGEPVLLIADIPPSAADLAERLGAPLIWFGNFGWDEIYAPFGGALADHAGAALEAYRRGTLLLRCPFALGIGLETARGAAGSGLCGTMTSRGSSGPPPRH